MMAYDYPHPVSRTYQYKKITKPLLERKRRARINRCLEELKDLMVDALETEGESISKLEKADILELTVRHLQTLQESGSSALSSIVSSNNDITSESRWQLGFGHCAKEACRYLTALPGESGETLARHLASRLQSSRKINIQIMPKDGIIPPISRKTDENSNHLISRNTINVLPIAESTQVPSPINSPQYCEVYEESNNTLAINLHKQDVISHQNGHMPTSLSTSNTPNNFQSGNSPDMFFQNDDKNDDDEEIDVVRIDESDPMWRPW